ncbi:hypothetical protein BFJ69_g14951 [Fusarium oxysporum]|uniref:Uncharacterized protein n=1 Tax=Fusarium oxysporum TaxID=5507 RepID=A0A420MFZ9_FUSOX|nr:hypothetical protein BFJ69_g14951 [Fusarium oxysporum]
MSLPLMGSKTKTPPPPPSLRARTRVLCSCYQDLVGFSADDFEAVRVATSAYGIHLFGKLRIPALPDPSGPSYIHFRVFIGGGDEPPKLHSIHTEEREDSSGGKTYRAIFTKNDELKWFDT